MHHTIPHCTAPTTLHHTAPEKTVAQRNTLAPHCTTLHHTATQLSPHQHHYCLHTAPYHTAPHVTVPYHTTLQCTIPYHTALHLPQPYCTRKDCSAAQHTTLHHTAPHCTTLQHNAPHRTTLPRTAPYHTAPQCTIPHHKGAPHHTGTLHHTDALHRITPNGHTLPHGLTTPHHTALHHTVPHLDRGQTRQMCEKQEKYFKGKVVIFSVQSLILYQYAADLPTFLELYSKSSKYLKILTCWRPLSRQFCPGAQHLKIKKPVYVREVKIHLHSTAIMYIVLDVSTSL